MKTFSKIRDAQIFALMPAPIRELGNSTGFEMQLEDRGDLGHDALMAARDQLLDAARNSPMLTQVRPNGLDDTPQLHLDIDQAKANALGISIADINSTLSAAWGGAYINDFIDRGRVKRVYMQGDAPFRMAPEDLEPLVCAHRIRNDGAVFVVHDLALATGASASSNATTAGRRSNIQGQGAPGVSTGTAMDEMEKLVAQLPEGHRPGMDRRVVSGTRCRARRRRRCMRYRCSSCSCVSRRCMKVGRCRSRCCWSFRSASSAPCSRQPCAASTTTSISRSACSPRWGWRQRTRS